LRLQGGFFMPPTLPVIPAFAVELVTSDNSPIRLLNPDFAVGFVMKGKNPIKTGVCEDFWGEIIVNDAEVKKASKGSCWQEFWLAIESQLQNRG
jgi:hypothetical protein